MGRLTGTASLGVLRLLHPAWIRLVQPTIGARAAPAASDLGSAWDRGWRSSNLVVCRLPMPG